MRAQAGIAVDGHGPDVEVGVGQALRQLDPSRVIHVQHGGLQAGPAEQQRLGVPVGLHAAVEVEVVLREVGEHGHANRGAVQAPLHEADGRGLDGAGVQPLVHEIAQGGLEQHRVGRGQAGGH